MNTIPQVSAIDNLPVAELTDVLDTFLAPVLRHLPEKRLQEVGKLAVRGILAGQSPVVARIARGVAREEETFLPTAKRLYRFVWNRRFKRAV